jgi:hypothetical protein
MSLFVPAPRLLAAAAVLLLSTSAASAATITWDGGAGTLNWLTPANWSGDVLPGPNDDVVIDIPGDAVVTLAGNASIKSLVSSEGLVVSNSGGLTVATTASVSGPISLSAGSLLGGTWTAPGGLAPTTNGLNRLVGVTFNGSISVGTNVRLVVQNGLVLNGTLSMTGFNPRVSLDGTQTIGGNAIIDLEGNQNNPARLDVEGTSVVTFAPSVSILAGEGLIGSATFVVGPSTIVNQGTITQDVAGRTLSIVGESFVNEGDVVAAVGTLAIAPTQSWTNTIGEMRATTGGTLSLDGPVVASEVGVVQNVSGTVVVTATLDLAGGTLAFGPATGIWTFSAATVKNGDITIAPGFGPLFAQNNVVFDGIDVTGSFQLDSNRRLIVRNGFTLDGTLSMVGFNPRLVFDGTQIFDGNAVVQLDGNQLSPARIDVDGASVLTIASTVLLEGSEGQLGASFGFGGVSSIVNQGTIRSDTAGRTITILGEGFTNQGSVQALAGSIVVQPSQWSNTGSIVASGGTIRLEGAFTLADLAGVVNATGAVQIAGSINFGGQTLVLSPATGVYTFDGGTYTNGTIVVQAGGVPLFTGANTTFDGMTLSGTFPLGANQRLFVKNGLVLNGTLAMTGFNPRLVFDGTQTISGTGTITLDGSQNNPARVNVDGTSTVTFGPSILIEGGDGEIGESIFVGGVSTVVNQGTIRSKNANLSISLRGENFTNQGTIEATAGTLRVGSATVLSNTGLVRALTGGTVRIEGAATLASLGDLRNVSGTVVLAGPLPLGGGTLAFTPTTGVWTFDGATISGGTIAAPPGLAPILTGANTTFDGLTVSGTVAIGTNQRLFVKNGLVLNGTLAMTGFNPRLVFDGTQTISGTGTITLDGSQNNPARVNVDGTSTVTFGPSILIEGGDGEIGESIFVGGVSTVVNQGTIRSKNANLSISLRGENFTNQGTIEATAGTLRVGSATVLSNTGLVRALTGGTVRIEGAATLASLGDLRNVSGTVVLAGPLPLGGGTLAFTPTTGVWTLDGATISGGTIAAPPGLSPIFTGSNTVFDGLTVNGTFALGSNQRLWTRNGMVLNGTIECTGFNPRFVADGTQTISGTGTLILQGQPNNGARLNLESATVLTIGPSITVECGHADLGAALQAAGASTILNQGRIRTSGAGTTTLINTNPGDVFTNQGIVEVLAGGTTVVLSTSNLDANGVLTGGSWRATSATLRFGSQAQGLPIRSLAAEATLSGATATITDLAKLESIATNGVLRLEGGAILNAVPASGTLLDAGFLFVNGPSRLNITGGFTHTATAVLTILVSAANQTFVDATATATLGGVLQVANGPAFTPVPGDQVVVAEGASRVGTFATLTSCEESDLFYTPTQAVFVYGKDTGILGDLNGDGSVGPADLALLLGSWGTCSDLCCKADLDLNGTVDSPDLALLLGSWG